MGQSHPVSSRLITRQGKDPKRSRMCGRYSLICIDDLGNRFRVFDPMMGSRSRFNITPGNEMPVIVRRKRTMPRPCAGGSSPLDKGYPYCKTPDQCPCGDPWGEACLPIPAEYPTVSCPASGFFEWKKEGNMETPRLFPVNR